MIRIPVRIPLRKIGHGSLSNCLATQHCKAQSLRYCVNGILAAIRPPKSVPCNVTIMDPEMLTHWKWFGEWSIGCIGILSDWVVETAATLCRAGETVLTLEALAKHALKPAQCLKLETEARTGEFKIEEAKKESERELQRLLGRPSTVPMRARCHIPHCLPVLRRVLYHRSLTRPPALNEHRTATQWVSRSLPERVQNAPIWAKFQ